MASVTQRSKQFKQPRGGFIKPSQLETIVLDDGVTLNDTENVHGSIIGMVVDYLTRFVLGEDKAEAFKIALIGAEIAERGGIKNAEKVAAKLLKGIKGLDDKSINNACKLVTFDVWYRNLFDAMLAKTYEEINPDKATIENIRTYINRSTAFFENYGPVTVDGFTFEPPTPDHEAYQKMLDSKKGSYGGYTSTVSKGDGDFLTADTLWDFKVAKTKPTSKHTLQLLMYWIMGKHSGQDIFRGITKIGIFNARLNTVYLYDISNVSTETLKTVEHEVIGYEEGDERPAVTVKVKVRRK